MEKILFVEKPNDKKKVKPKISGEKNVSTKVVRVYRGLRYESIPFVLRQYHQFFKVKIHSGTDNFKTTLRQFERYIYVCALFLQCFMIYLVARFLLS